MAKSVSGFSKLNKAEKISWLTDNFFSDPKAAKSVLKQYWNSEEKLQQLHDEFIENTVSNFYLPLGIAPNFDINGKLYAIPMATEESSVVAAASRAAKFWSKRGGFKTKVLSTTKIGHVHFTYNGSRDKFTSFFETNKNELLNSVKPITANMEKRGGGVLDLHLVDKTQAMENYYQLEAKFETRDAMGANFINSCLEQFAQKLLELVEDSSEFTSEETIEIIMSILSNYVPECLVRAEVSCSIEDLNEDNELSPDAFAEKFVRAVKIAEIEPYRAVTHNKGLMNGIDAVVVATGNDFRAVEAGIHAYASKDGTYSSLSHAKINDGIFTFWMEIPLALGTVGGLTRLHPLVKLSLELLGNPTAMQLMQIVAAAGLAQNFGAVRSLITTGIQQGHMKMHLLNILNEFKADNQEKDQLIKYFEDQLVTHSAVAEKLKELRTS